MISRKRSIRKSSNDDISSLNNNSDDDIGDENIRDGHTIDAVKRARMTLTPGEICLQKELLLLVSSGDNIGSSGSGVDVSGNNTSFIIEHTSERGVIVVHIYARITRYMAPATSNRDKFRGTFSSIFYGSCTDTGTGAADADGDAGVMYKCSFRITIPKYYPHHCPAICFLGVTLCHNASNACTVPNNSCGVPCWLQPAYTYLLPSIRAGTMAGVGVAKETGAANIMHSLQRIFSGGGGSDGGGLSGGLSGVGEGSDYPLDTRHPLVSEWTAMGSIRLVIQTLQEIVTQCANA